MLRALAAAPVAFGCTPGQPAPAPLPAPSLRPATSPVVLVSAPEPSAPTAAEPPEGPDPTAVDTLVWGRVTEKPGMVPTVRTYWLGVGAATYEVKGQLDAVLIAQDRQVWQAVVREYEHNVVCKDADLRERLGATSTTLGLRLEPVGAPGGVEVIAGDTNPLQCESVRYPAITLEGSVGSYLLVREYREVYSGGAHGIVFESFQVRDLATGAARSDWSRDVKATTADIEGLKARVGQPPGSRGRRSAEPYVKLSPSSLKSSYAPDGSQAFHVCFTVEDTNIPELTIALSHGAVELGDCVAAPTPPRLAADAAAPTSVARFARRQHLTIGGWSRLRGGKPLPAAVQALLVGKK